MVLAQDAAQRNQGSARAAQRSQQASAQSSDNKKSKQQTDEDKRLKELESQRAKYQSKLSSLGKGTVGRNNSFSAMSHPEYVAAYNKFRNTSDPNVKAQASAQMQSVQAQLAVGQTRQSLALNIQRTEREMAKVEAGRKAAAQQALKKADYEKIARTRIESSRTATEQRSNIYDFRDTDYVKNTFGVIASPNYQKAKAIYDRDGGSGGALNRAATADKQSFVTGVSATTAFNAIQKDYQTEKNVRKRQSAGLQAQGSAQIASASRTELARLGGGTLVSANINQNRAPKAPGVAAKAQDFPLSFQRAPQQAAISNDSVKNFAAIADPNASGFGKSKVQAVVPPMRNDQSIRSRINPMLIPQAQRSDIGYSPAGLPIQGPSRQGVKYSVKDSKGKVRTFNSLEAAEKFSKRLPRNVVAPIGSIESNYLNYSVKTPEGTKRFATEKQAADFISQREKTPNLQGTSRTQYGISKFLDRAAQYKSDNPIVNTAFVGLIAQPLGAVRSIVEGVNVADNVGRTILPKYTGIGKVNTDPIPIHRTGDETILPVAITDTGVGLKSPGQIGRDTIDYSKRYSVPDLIGGAAVTYVPIAAGIKTVGTAAGKLIVRKTSPKLVSVATRESKPTRTLVKSPRVISARKPYQVSGDELLGRVKSSQQSISGTTRLTPNKNVRLDPNYRPSNPTLTTGYFPKDNVVGKITLSKGFVPGKAERIAKPLQQKPVQPDPYYKPAGRANEIDVSGSSLDASFTSTRISTTSVGKVISTKPPSRFTSTRISFMSLGRPPKSSIPQAAKTPERISRKPFRLSDVSKGTGGTRGTVRRFSDPKVEKGDRLVGSGGSLQITKQKPVLKKKSAFTSTRVSLSTTQSPSRVTMASIPRMAPARTATVTKQATGAKTTQSSAQSITAKQGAVQESAAANQAAITGQVSRTGQAARSGQGTKSSARSSVSFKPMSALKPAVKTGSILATGSAQAFASPSSQKPKLSSRQAFKAASPQRQSARLAQPSTPPRKKKVVPVLPFLDDDKKKKKRGSSRQKRPNDFLGNTRLDSIEGLFRRSDVIHGDRAISKQVRKDRKSGFKTRQRIF